MVELSKWDKLLLAISICGAATCFALMQRALEFNTVRRGEVVAHIRKLRNDVRTRDGGSLTWREAQTNSAIVQGQTVYTGDDSSTEIELANHSKIQVGPKTMLVLGFEGSRVNVEIKAGTAELTLIKGADVVVERAGRRQVVAAEGEISTTVVRSAAEAQPADVASEPVQPVQPVQPAPPAAAEREPAAAEPTPSDAIALDSKPAPAPYISPVLATVAVKPGEPLEQPRPVKVAWHDPASHGAYELQISRSGDFSERQSYFTTDAAYSLNVPLGTVHYARVRAMKSFDVPASEFSAPTKVVLQGELRMDPPGPDSPADGAEVSFFSGQPRAVLFRWQPVWGAEKYEVQISAADAEAPLVTAETNDDSFVWRAPNDHRQVVWKIRAKAGRGVSSWSAPRALKINFP